MVFEAIAGGLVKAALPKVAGAIATAVKHKLNPTELEKALKVGLQKSGAFDRGQKVNNAVFYRCTDKDADTFLAALLEHPEVQHELQKPLEQDGAPEVAILVQVAKHIATDRALDIQDDTLEPWLKTFANAYFEAITAIRFQVAQANYLKQLANWFDDVKFAGVAVPGQDVERAERLAQIFVMPDVEEDGGMRSRMALERSFFEEQGEQGRQGELLQEQRWRAQLERSGRKFSARQLLNQHQKKIVLLGAPGSGKTTLMSFFAVTLAERQGAIAPASDAFTEGSDRDRTRMVSDTEGSDRDAEGMDRNRSQRQRDPIAMYTDAEGLRLDTQGLQTDTDALLLPILIRIRDWARTPDVTIPEYARQFAETTMSCKLLPKGFFEHWLNNGRALILLDGLDEVAEEAKRYHLVQCIENFLGQYPQNRAIITSRPAGYKRDFFRTEEFPHYELQPFDDGKIEEFCDRWYTSRVPDKAEAQRRKESLQKALNQQDRIKLLARNPLLLTIIALIHRYQARLPRERYKLYDKAVETLLTAWDDNKELSNQTVLQYLQLDDLRRLMETLAYWIHTQGTTGDTEGGTLIDKDELIQKLTQEIKTLKQLKQYEAKAEAERFVRFIRDRTGLLNEQGQDCYAFVHKTFQEYLAAQDINYQADNEDDFEIVLTHIEQHLHDPHWREVLLLLIAQQSPKKAARAIRKVLTANSPYEQWLHRDLLFAGHCLAEDPKGLRNADVSLSSEILKLMVELEVSALSKVGRKVREHIFQVLCSLYETTFEVEALQLLKALENHMDEVRLQQYRAELGEKEEAIKTLMPLVKSSSLSLRNNSTKALYSLSNAPESLLQELKMLLDGKSPKLLQDDDSSWAYGTIAEALGNLGKGSRTIFQYFLSLLQDENPGKRAAAARGLASLNHNSELVQDLLIKLLIDDEETPAQKTFYTYSLSNSFSNSEKTLKAVLCLLKDEKALESEALLNWVFSMLTSSAKEFPGILQELLELVKSTHSRTRVWAALVLSNVDYTSEEITRELESALEDIHPIACSLAGRELFKLGKSSQVILQNLLLHIDHKADWQSSRVIQALGTLNDIPEAITEQLLKIIVESKSHQVWSGTAEALGKLGKRSHQVEPAIVQWIEQHQDEDCVGAGIDALWEIVEGE